MKTIFKSQTGRADTRASLSFSDSLWGIAAVPSDGEVAEQRETGLRRTLSNASADRAFRSILSPSFSTIDSDVEDTPSYRDVVSLRSSSSARQTDAASFDWRVDIARFEREFVDALLADPYEPGRSGEADRVLDRWLRQNAGRTMAMLNQVFLKNYSSPSIAADVLATAGRLPRNVAQPTVVTMAIAGLASKFAVVQEAGIRAFERWSNPDDLELLKCVDYSASWLRDYANAVIADIEAVV